MTNLRIGFMGTPDFAAGALKAMCEAGYTPQIVYSQPPRPKGRGHQVQPSPVHILAEQQGTPVFTPLNFKDRQAVEAFKAQDLDVAIVAAYGLILPQEILDAPKYGCINIHASLLPRWRGASPIQHAIWAGDQKTGIGLMQMERGLDTGPVIAERSIPLTNEDTAFSLHNALCEIGGEMVIDTLKRLVDGKADNAEKRLPSMPQDEEQTTYAPLLTKEHGRINWAAETANQIDRKIRALNPWPGVWCERNGERFKILEARPCDETTFEHPGAILSRDGKIPCADGTILQIMRLQPPGKTPMDFEAAVNGGYLGPGEKLT